MLGLLITDKRRADDRRSWRTALLALATLARALLGLGAKSVHVRVKRI